MPHQNNVSIRTRTGTEGQYISISPIQPKGLRKAKQPCNLQSESTVAAGHLIGPSFVTLRVLGFSQLKPANAPPNPVAQP